MSDKQQNPWLGDIWELGYTRQRLFVMVRRINGDTITVIPMTSDMALQDKDSVIVWPRMPFHVDRRHMVRRVGRFGFRTIRMLAAGQRDAVYGVTPAEHPAAPHSKEDEKILSLFVYCLFLNEAARMSRKRLEELHAMTAGM